MKKLWNKSRSLILVCSLLAGTGGESITFAQENATATIAGFNISDTGVISRDGVSFTLVHVDEAWQGSSPRRDTLRNTRHKEAKGARASFHLSTDWVARDGVTFSMQENVTATGEDAISSSIQLRSKSGGQGHGIMLRSMFDANAYKGRPLLIDGVAYTFGDALDSAKARFGGNASTIILPLENGSLTLSGALSWQFQDNRLYGSNRWELRLWLRNTARVPATDASLTMQLSYEPYASYPVALNSVANMGFADDVANDGKGGWTDQGPDNDLRSLPVGKQVFGGIEFDIIAPESNQGNAAVILRGEDRPHFPKSVEINLPKPVSGQYLYLLHAVAWQKANRKVGTVSVQIASSEAHYVDREILNFDINAATDVSDFWNPANIPNGTVVWKGKNPSADIGLYLTRLDLVGKQVEKITLESADESVWMIAGMTLSDKRSADTPEDETVILKANEEYATFGGSKQVKKGSILDLSGMLDAPAGKYGFVRAAGDHFEFENRPGKAVRFYGANQLGIPDKNKETTDLDLDYYAATGYNIIRLHHFDRELRKLPSGQNSGLNRWELDAMDYFVAACKARGIYITLDLYTQRLPGPGQIPGYPEGISSPAEYKMLTLLDDRVFNDLKTFSEDLLNHVNPYTGVAWKDEAAIAFISLVNENTIYAHHRATPLVRNLMDEKFKDYAWRHGIEPTAENQSVHEKRFLFETYAEGFKRLKRLSQELGIRVPITDQNFYMNLATTLQRDAYDYVDTHFYWRHPVGLGGVSWQPPQRIESESAILRHGGAVLESASIRLYGKPFTVSEWEFCAPSSYNTEGALLVGAVAAAQDWSGLMRFSFWRGFSLKEYGDDTLGAFWAPGRDPQINLSERMGVLLFLRGDVTPSTESYPLLLARNHLDISTMDQVPRVAQHLGLLGKTGIVITDEDSEAGIATALPPETKAAISLSPGLSAKGKINGATIYSSDELGLATARLGLNKNPLVNDTGELVLNAAKGVLSVLTDRSESFVLPQGQTAEGNFVTVKGEQSFSTLMVAAMDERDLVASDRYLILHLTNTKGTGMRFRNKEMTIIEDWGKPPLLAQRGQVQFRFNRDLQGFKLYALDLTGERLFPVNMQKQDGKYTFTAKNTVGDDFIAIYELVRE